MEVDTNGGDSSAPAAVETAANNDVKEMTQAQYAEFLVKQATQPAATKKPDETPAVVEEAAADEVDTTEADKAAEASTETQSEQSESTADAPETEEVLSKSEPIPPDKFAKWQADVQKRIDRLTAEKKAYEAQVEQLRATPAEAPAPVIIPSDNPDDKTVTATSEVELEKVVREAQAALDFIEDNRTAINRAIFRDEDTVVIAGQQVPVEQITKAEREAKRHLDRYIPARRQFLKAHTEASVKAQAVMPALFDKATPEYQEYQAFKRANPAFNHLPNADYLYAMQLKGQAAMKAEQDGAKKPVASAAAKAPKTAGDTGSTASGKPAATRGVSGERAKITAELEKAQKAFRQNGSQDNYSRVLVLQSRLKKL